MIKLLNERAHERTNERLMYKWLMVDAQAHKCVTTPIIVNMFVRRAFAYIYPSLDALRIFPK